MALHAGRYDEAARHFEAVLDAAPDDLPALIGLGVARYRLGALDTARAPLARAAERAPKNQEACLYLALIGLRRRDDAEARIRLAQLRRLGPSRRLALQIERALPLIRPDLDEALREFMAASLEDELEWERDVREARLAAAHAHPSWIIYPGYPPWHQ
jgi:Flp pilus assembly protein TadD